MKKRLILAGAAVLLLIAGGICLFYYFSEREKPVSALEKDVAETISTSFEVQPEEKYDMEAETPDSVSQLVSYASPVDFDSLQAVNGDVYAWLYIPGTDINYPLVQHASDDEYYLKHNSSGDKDSKGALFTQATYNSMDFSDPVTVIYGHHMKSGVMFGHLQNLYSSLDAIREHQEIIIYLPEREVHYTAFAGLSHDSSHLLYYNDFNDEEVFQAFLDETVSVRSIGTNADPEVSVSTDDKLLILSTCLEGNSQKRYLVLAVED